MGQIISSIIGGQQEVQETKQYAFSQQTWAPEPTRDCTRFSTRDCDSIMRGEDQRVNKYTNLQRGHAPEAATRRTRFGDSDYRTVLMKDEVAKEVNKRIPLHKPVTVKEKRIKHYSSRHNILLVGEGDFSFSACLAAAFGSAINMVATSLDSYEFLRQNYGCAVGNIFKLKAWGGNVLHGVDATEMGMENGIFQGRKFDRIVFNFPHAGFSNRGESQEAQIRLHQTLVLRFLWNAKELVSAGGEIHISHKSNGFYGKWNIEQLGCYVGLCLIGAEDFSLNHYPGYNTKYGFGGDRNFNCYPSLTFKFGL